MGKILGSWSDMRKFLEQDMLAESLQNRIQYHCARYRNVDDHFKMFEIRVDGQTVKRFSFETVNTYFIENDIKNSQR